MSVWNDINSSISSARHTLAVVKDEAHNIGTLVTDPIILRNMSGRQLANIKKQLRKFNASTRVWSDQNEGLY